MSLSTVERWMRSGKLPSIKVGGARLVPMAGLERLLEPPPPRRREQRRPRPLAGGKYLPIFPEFLRAAPGAGRGRRRTGKGSRGGQTPALPDPEGTPPAAGPSPAAGGVSRGGRCGSDLHEA